MSSKANFEVYNGPQMEDRANAQINWDTLFFISPARDRSDRQNPISSYLLSLISALHTCYIRYTWREILNILVGSG